MKGQTVTDPLSSLSPQDALIAVMVAVSASDETIRTVELIAIERMVNHMPIFADYDIDRIRPVAQTVYSLFEEEEGIEALFGLVRAGLPEKLFETAYALACDIGAADGRLYEGEVAMLAEIRHQMNIPRLHAAAIELSAQVRHRVL